MVGGFGKECKEEEEEVESDDDEGVEEVGSCIGGDKEEVG